MKRPVPVFNLILSITLLFIANTAFATEPTWINYSSYGHVKGMYAHKGSMWVATLGGLVKYDAATGKKTYFSKAASNLPSNTVEEVAADPSGNIWIGTYDAGIAMFDGSKWTTYNTTNSILPSDAVLGIEADKAGNIYVGTSKGLVIINGNNWQLLNDETQTHVRQLDIWALDWDDETGLWIGTDQGVYNYHNSHFTDYTDSLPLYGINDIDYSAAYGVIAVGGGGTFRMKLNTHKWEMLGDMNNFPEMSSPQYITVDAGNNLWVTTFNAAFKYDGSEWSGTAKDEAANHLLALCSDENGVLWGAGWNGISRLTNNQWQSVTALNNTIPSNYVRSLASDKKGTMWINNNTAVTRYTKDGWEVFNAANSKIPANSFVQKIRVDKSGNAWFATDKGLIEFTGDNWILFDEETSNLQGNNITDVAFDNSGNIWAVHENGISIIDSKEGNQITNPAMEENERLLTLVLTGDNTAWLSTNRGNIYRYNNKSWQRYSFDDKTFAGGYVMDMRWDAKTNKIWAGTWGGGLNYFDGEKWNEYETGQPIIISSLLLDANNNMWSSSLYPTTLKIQKHDGASILYDPYNSPLPLSNINALEEDGLGNIWIGTETGLLVYQTNESAGIPAEKNLDNSGMGKLYPNPAAAQTTLAFTLGKKSQVQINITDVTGRIVSTLPIENLSAGEHKINMPVNDLPNGTYLVKLQADNLSLNYKLVVNK